MNLNILISCRGWKCTLPVLFSLDLKKRDDGAPMLKVRQENLKMVCRETLNMTPLRKEAENAVACDGKAERTRPGGKVVGVQAALHVKTEYDVVAWSENKLLAR
jgi:hypothetical protein